MGKQRPVKLLPPIPRIFSVYGDLWGKPQAKWGKIWTRKTPNEDNFHALIIYFDVATKKHLRFSVCHNELLNLDSNIKQILMN